MQRLFYQHQCHPHRMTPWVFPDSGSDGPNKDVLFCKFVLVCLSQGPLGSSPGQSCAHLGTASLECLGWYPGLPPREPSGTPCFPLPAPQEGWGIQVGQWLRSNPVVVHRLTPMKPQKGPACAGLFLERQLHSRRLSGSVGHGGAEGVRGWETAALCPLPARLGGVQPAVLAQAPCGARQASLPARRGLGCRGRAGCKRPVSGQPIECESN